MNQIDRDLSRIHAKVAGSVAGKYSDRSLADKGAVTRAIMNDIESLIYTVVDELADRINAGIEFKRPWR